MFFDMICDLGRRFCAIFSGGPFEHEHRESNGSITPIAEDDAELTNEVVVAAVASNEVNDVPTHYRNHTPAQEQQYAELKDDKRNFVVEGKFRYQVLPTAPDMKEGLGEQCTVEMRSGRQAIYTVTKKVHENKSYSDDVHDWVFTFIRYK